MHVVGQRQDQGLQVALLDPRHLRGGPRAMVSGTGQLCPPQAMAGPSWVRHSSRKVAAQLMGREARHQEGEGRGTGETRKLDRKVGEAKEGQEGTQQGAVMDRGTEEQGPDCRDREPRPMCEECDWCTDSWSQWGCVGGKPGSVWTRHPEVPT